MSSIVMTDGKSAVGSRAASVSPAYQILKFLGSLKITVTMFALGILITFVGTLAQDEMDLADVKREFFTSWISYAQFDVLFPVTIFPHDDMVWFNGAGVYIPGGATIGLILLINLIAAKATRFSVSAKGAKLTVGLLISFIGFLLIAAVISSGHFSDGLQGKPPVDYDTLWGGLKAGCVVISLALLGYALVAKLPKLAKIFVWLAALVAVAMSGLLLSGGESVRLDDPGLRIVWQLLQATIASSVLLVGLSMVFGKRGGNVLIHVGVGLLMVGQFVFGDRQVEQRIGLAEGASTNLAVISDQIELALIDTSDSKEDVVYAIPESILRSAASSGEVIEDAELPVNLKVLRLMKNSQLAAIDQSTENLATTGFGLQAQAIEVAPIGGAMMDSINIAAAYVQLLDKSNKPIETLLLSQERNDLSQLAVAAGPDKRETISIDGKSFEVAIRYRQERKPYDVFLKDVERINYSGTDTPRDYSSRIVITDRETGESQEGKTWMNNPIRYKGETFYQSRYNRVPVNGKVIETTGLQVVENSGWVIPYVACMMAFVGMFAHFGGTFVTFAGRYSRGAIPTTVGANQKVAGGSGVFNAAVAIAALGTCALVAGYFAKPESFSRSDVDWVAIENLPMQHEGRTKPLDSVARNILQGISKPVFGNVPNVTDGDGNKRRPSEWLVGTIAGSEWVEDAEVFRLYAPEVRDFFDLKGRRGYRYSYNEMKPKLAAFREEIDKLRNKDSDNFDFREQKLAQVHQQLNAFDLLRFSYQLPPLPAVPEDESEESRQSYLSSIMNTFEMMQRLEAGGPPGIIPPQGEATEKNLVDAKWQAYGPAVFTTFVGQQMGLAEAGPNPAVLAFTDVLDAIRTGTDAEVNESVREYQKLLSEMPLAAVNLDRAATERWLNKFNPTAQGVLLYLVAIALGFCSFLVKKDYVRRGTFWLLVGVFVIHTVAIIARVYISGRAPVINLYSSAVFIGWACVCLSLVLELVYPIGIANLVAAFTGAATLSVARLLDTSDTMPVLQAVLDTQFWLSTHVITVTAGYAVTFLAGFLGIAALVHRMVTGYDAYTPANRPKAAEELQQILYRMTYGVVCFAIFFSFIGTVLGGLWADDSWGRFWGWDPKENGALMIVLWNAILLHARWDKMVGPRGFALLAVLGNVMTAWSWFGTNQLGIGLHSYGFTSGVLMTLGIFVGANLLFVVVAWGVTRATASAAKRISAS